MEETRLWVDLGFKVDKNAKVEENWLILKSVKERVRGTLLVLIIGVVYITIYDLYDFMFKR